MNSYSATTDLNDDGLANFTAERKVVRKKPRPKAAQERRCQIGAYWLSQQSRSISWCRTWYDSRNGQTRRESLGTSDEPSARLLLAKWVTENVVGTKVAPTDMPIATVLLRHYEKTAQKQISGPQTKIAFAYWVDFWGETMVGGLTMEKQEEFISWLRTKKHSDSYINRTLACGRRALTLAVRANELTSAPHVIEAAPQNAVRDMARPKGRPLTAQQVADLFDAITEPHLWAFCMMAANTVGRPEALLTADIKQYDNSFEIFHLNPPGRVQTKKFRPTVPVTKTLKPLLDRIKTGPIITYKGKAIKSVRGAFRAACQNAGLGDDVEPYSFRHTLGREMRRRKVPQDELSIIMGHRPRDSSQTSEIYAPYEADYCKAAAKAIDAFMRDVARLSKLKLRCPDPPAVVETARKSPRRT
jgi:hypothetical protein